MTLQMAVVLAVVALTFLLFMSDRMRSDVVALSMLILLALLSFLPPLTGLLAPSEIFSGFASNAVIAIVAVMILGAGLDKSGLMSRITQWMLRVSGHGERRISTSLSLAAGLVSGFLQNAGVAALLLPALARISTRTGIALSRLLLPVGFCILLGGTMTLIGSSPLIILNDLLPRDMAPFRLFDVFWVGLTLLAAGVVYFALWGCRLVPVIESEGTKGASALEYFKNLYGLDFVIRELRLDEGSAWAGLTVADVERETGLTIVATYMKQELRFGPWRGLEILPRAHLAALGHASLFDDLREDTTLQVNDRLDVFADAMSPLLSGMAEVVIPPNSQLQGKTVTEIAMRKTYGLSVVAIHRGEETIRKNIRDIHLRSGDTLVCHCAWEALARLEKDRNFVIVTTAYPHEETRPLKVPYAVFFFLLAIGLALFTHVPLAVAFFAGALGMVWSGVLTMDEAYRAVSWRTVFLLGALIPLGHALDRTGAATWMAQHLMMVFGGASPWVLQVLLALLATFFALVMSNVGATILLVPIAVQMAWASQAAGSTADPRLFVLTVAVAATNGFLLPTNPVMSIYMGPGGYRNKDIRKVGWHMTVLFLVVAIVMLNVTH